MNSSTPQANTENPTDPLIPNNGFKTFEEFYPFYLQQHRNKTSRRLHVIGTSSLTMLAGAALLSWNLYLVLFVPLVGYGFAWVGHFFFEKNKPATFKYPFYSLKGDFVMTKDVLTGKIAW